MRDESKALKVLLLVAALMMCVAVIPNLPQVFFFLLRWVVFGAAAYAAYKLRPDPKFSRHFIPLVIVAVLFNPFLPTIPPPLFWLLLDLGGAVYFLQLSKKIGLP